VGNAGSGNLRDPMAEIHPLRAVHYDTRVAGPLDRLTAPPYDVIEPALRRALVARSPHNVVEIDLPVGDDPYRHAGELWREWQREGVLRRDPEPALWALEQTYGAPGGGRRTRRGFFTRVRVTDYGPGLIRPHERTHPAPKQDRLELMRATRANLSPIFSLYRDPEAAAWNALAPALAQEPWDSVTDDDGTTHRLWRVTDPGTIDAVGAAIADRELLIADGHHRYETARTYADEVGGEGDHRYVLMCLVSMSDPGLTVFPTHRLVGRLEAKRRARLEQELERDFEVDEIDADSVVPESENSGRPTYGYLDQRGRALRLRLGSPDVVDRALADHSPSYRSLDTAVLEKLVLEDALGLTEDDISHQHGLAYARDLTQARELLETGDYELAFLLRPTPIAQVEAVAAAGETMPPKSTYFYPKLLSGLLFNPLE
jgi:uncharacterized protein (DUF1015 family)